MLIFVFGGFVLFVGGLCWCWIVGVVLVVVLIVVVMWFFIMYDYQKQWVLIFFDLESDLLGIGWNIIQFKVVIGFGGVFGKGWLLGIQLYLDFLLESYIDFIIVVFGEEFGLVGVCLLLVFYLLLISCGLVIIVQVQMFYGKLLVGGIIMMFFVYVFVNIGMVSGLLLVVGVLLFFISYGGILLVILLLGFGVLMLIYIYWKWIVQV